MRDSESYVIYARLHSKKAAEWEVHLLSLRIHSENQGEGKLGVESVATWSPVIMCVFTSVCPNCFPNAAVGPQLSFSSLMSLQTYHITRAIPISSQKSCLRPISSD